MDHSPRLPATGKPTHCFGVVSRPVCRRCVFVSTIVRTVDGSPFRLRVSSTPSAPARKVNKSGAHCAFPRPEKYQGSRPPARRVNPH
jgi:hypothetical protein